MPETSALTGSVAASPGRLFYCSKKKEERQCHCPTKTKRHHLNGMKSMLDLEAGIIRCGH
ncbi:hypothetical protein [Synechococcus sp. MVIR-18-1]|uniref:hypothetical protein n=1 Tax=Synechococcus sp. MVIR-18-1 TaxID=1386941 RepID=UPI001861B877|nr:hypothetical protein [Synechococcus sp. MVIR-18-1]QNI76197.1 hypothetical protein SynMVIR181_01218 [Synechococcus sp. MVIR-18-1]